MQRVARTRHYLMCPPTHFAVTYAINPWMDPDAGVDVDLALTQWTSLADAYRMLGHQVDTIAPVAGLPDMVFAANGAVVVDGIALGSRFRFPERAAEAEHYADWLRTNGFGHVHQPEHTIEGEGDLLVADDVVLAGTGFRTDVEAHAWVAEVTGREVVTLELVDPRYYHLDTALCVLDATTIAYLPEAFSDAAREELARRYPDAIRVAPEDAVILACNAVSDGRNVVIPAGTVRFADDLRDRGFAPVEVDLSELLKAGGGPKCCTLELRPARAVDTLIEEVSA
jgi:N-dimethylarginine dimethylaminohydrolase